MFAAHTASQSKCAVPCKFKHLSTTTISWHAHKVMRFVSRCTTWADKITCMLVWESPTLVCICWLVTLPWWILQLEWRDQCQSTSNSAIGLPTQTSTTSLLKAGRACCHNMSGSTRAGVCKTKDAMHNWAACGTAAVQLYKAWWPVILSIHSLFPAATACTECLSLQVSTASSNRWIHMYTRDAWLHHPHFAAIWCVVYTLVYICNVGLGYTLYAESGSSQTSQEWCIYE